MDGIEALHLEKYDHKPPLEVVSPQGLEREYEGLEHQRDGHASTHELKTPGSAPEKTTKKKWIVATSILVVVVVALAAGLGAGLRHKSKYTLLSFLSWNGLNNHLSEIGLEAKFYQCHLLGSRSTRHHLYRHLQLNQAIGVQDQYIRL